MLPYSSSFTRASLLFALCCSISIGQFAAASEQISLPGCPSTCGNLSIPYPFGIGERCARRGFHLSCNSTTAFLGNGTIEVLNISLLQGQARVGYHLAFDCYSKNGTRRNNTAWADAGKNYPYTFSDVQNKFTAIGCDNYAYIVGANSSGFTGGCVSVCVRPDNVVDGSCSGIGCCQTAIPKGLKYYDIYLGSYYKHSRVWSLYPCSYAFLVDMDWFTFKAEDLSIDSRYRQMGRVPLVLDWVAGNESCDAARKDRANFACQSQHSDCYDSTSSATGYLCNCSTGYEGNPYLKDGCRGINFRIQQHHFVEVFLHMKKYVNSHF